MSKTWKYFEALAAEHELIQMTVLYEDLEAGIRTKLLMDCVQTGLGPDLRSQLGFWRFDWLREQSLRNAAFSAARNSELLLVSLGSGNPLPAELEKWIDAWSREPKTKHGTALGVLLAKDPAASPISREMRDRFQRAARLKEADFFCEPLSKPATEVSARLEQKSSPPLWTNPRSNQAPRVEVFGNFWPGRAVAARNERERGQA